LTLNPMDGVEILKVMNLSLDEPKRNWWDLKEMVIGTMGMAI